MSTHWTAFPHAATAFQYASAALKKHWARLHRGDVADGKGLPRDLAQPRRFGPGAAKAHGRGFKLPQQVEEIGIGDVRGARRHISARVPGFSGHATSVCDCVSRVRVRTKELTAA